MMHAYHPTLAGYDARQIWHDGCDECEHRSRSLPASVGQLDNARLHRAWTRMMVWRQDNIGDDAKDSLLGILSHAELPLLRHLESAYIIQRRLEGTW